MAAGEVSRSLSFSLSLFLVMADVQEPLHNSSEPSTSSSPPPWPSLPEFYAGKSIFLTGATGFMGKCLLEKILRDLPEVERIYILIRPKKDKSIEERVEAMSKLKVSSSFVSVFIAYTVSYLMWRYIVWLCLFTLTLDYMTSLFSAANLIKQ